MKIEIGSKKFTVDYVLRYYDACFFALAHFLREDQLQELKGNTGAAIAARRFISQRTNLQILFFETLNRKLCDLVVQYDLNKDIGKCFSIIDKMYDVYFKVGLTSEGSTYFDHVTTLSNKFIQEMCHLSCLALCASNPLVPAYKSLVIKLLEQYPNADLSEFYAEGFDTALSS